MNSFFKGDYVSPKEAVEKLGVHFQTLRNWDKDGKIKNGKIKSKLKIK